MTESESGTSEAGLGPDPSVRGGPPVSGGASTEGAVAPPYEGRTTTRASADGPAGGEGSLEREPSGPSEPAERRERAQGVAPGSRTEKLTDPDRTPGGRTETPADEQPAAEQVQTRDSDRGVGPAHYAGTPRGEDEAEAPEPGREDTGTKGPSQRPVGESGGRAATAVDHEAAGPPSPGSDQDR